MDTERLFLVERALRGAVALCVLASCVLWWISSFLTATTLSRQRNWLHSKWLVVDRSGWFSLPKRLILWLLRSKDSIKSDVVSSHARRWVHVLLTIPLQLGVLLWLRAGVANGFAEGGGRRAIICLGSALLVWFFATGHLIRGAFRLTQEMRGKAVGVQVEFALLRWWVGSVVPYSLFSILATLIWSWPVEFLKSIFWFGTSGILVSCTVALTLYFQRMMFQQKSIKTVELNLRKLGPEFIIFASSMVFCVTGIFSYATSISLQLTLHIPLELAVVVAVMMIPTYAVFTALAGGWFVTALFLKLRRLKVDTDTSNTNKKFVLFGWSVAVSFSLTFLALLIGHDVSPNAWIPRTVQMLSSNAFFDALTVVTMVWILEQAVSPHRRLSVPVVVVLNFVLGALFALSSLWCGLAFTERALSIKQVFRILIARSADGPGLEFGPYFFVMHTTFLPILCFLCVVLICWLGKALLVVTRWLLGRAKHEDINPVNMTAAFFGLIAALLAGILFVLTEWKGKPFSM